MALSFERLKQGEEFKAAIEGTKKLREAEDKEGRAIMRQFREDALLVKEAEKILASLYRTADIPCSLPPFRAFCDRNWLMFFGERPNRKVGDDDKCILLEYEGSDPNMILNEFSESNSRIYPLNPSGPGLLSLFFPPEIMREAVGYVYELVAQSVKDTAIYIDSLEKQN